MVLLQGNCFWLWRWSYDSSDPLLPLPRGLGAARCVIMYCTYAQWDNGEQERGRYPGIGVCKKNYKAGPGSPSYLYVPKSNQESVFYLHCLPACLPIHDTRDSVVPSPSKLFSFFFQKPVRFVSLSYHSNDGGILCMIRCLVARVHTGESSCACLLLDDADFMQAGEALQSTTTRETKLSHSPRSRGSMLASH